MLTDIMSAPSFRLHGIRLAAELRAYSPPIPIASSRSARSWPSTSLHFWWAPWWAYGGHSKTGQSHKALTCEFVVGVTRFELVASSVSDGPGRVAGKREMLCNACSMAASGVGSTTAKHHKKRLVTKRFAPNLHRVLSSADPDSRHSSTSCACALPASASSS